MAEVKEKPSDTKKPTKKRELIPQSFMPTYSFVRALTVAQALNDEFGAKSAEPHLLAQSLNLSPTSTTWRMLSGSSIAYGLTDAGYNAKKITITNLGKSIVMPTEEGVRKKGILEAILKPKLTRDFFSKYDKAKLPSKDIGMNVLKSLGIPSERAAKALDIIVENGEYAGIISSMKTGGFFVSIPADDFDFKKDSSEEIAVDKPMSDEFSSTDEGIPSENETMDKEVIPNVSRKSLDHGQYSINLNIQLQLPESTNPDVYDKLFESMKKHLLK